MLGKSLSPSVCGAGFRRQAQLSVGGTGGQQLHFFQPFRQLPPLLLLSHGGAGRAEDQHAEEKTVGFHIAKMSSSALFSSSRRLSLSYFCSYIVLELVETERDYVQDLGLVVEVSPRYLGLFYV